MLHVAVSRDDARLFDYLLSLPSRDLNAQESHGFSPLHVALGSKRLELARRLIAEGADVNVKTNENMTPLHQGILVTFLEMRP